MLYQESRDRSRARAPFKVYADAQPSTPVAAAAPPVSKPKHAQLQKPLSGSMAGCAVLRELNANTGFKLSPNSQIRAEKENFDPVKKQFVCYKNMSSKSDMASTPLKEKKNSGGSGLILGDRMAASRVPSYGNCIKNQENIGLSESMSNRRSDVLSAQTDTRIPRLKRPVLVHNSGVKKLSLLLDDMALSTGQKPTSSAYIQRPHNRTDKAVLQRLSLPPPAFVQSGRQHAKNPSLAVSNILAGRSRSMSLQAAAVVDRGYSASNTERAYRPSYTVDAVGKDRNVHTGRPKVPRSNSSGQARMRQLNVNILTPPDLRHSIR